MHEKKNNQDSSYKHPINETSHCKYFGLTAQNASISRVTD